MSTWDVIGTHRCRLGEGPVWDAAHGCLWMVDIADREILRHVPGTDTLDRWAVGEKVGAVWPAADGGLVGAAERGFVRWEPGGEVTEFAFPAGEPEGNRFNDGAVDAAGRFWAGSMEDAEEQVAGSWYRLDPDGTCRRMLDGGVRAERHLLESDGSVLYLADSPRHEITAYDYDLATGEASSPRSFATVADAYPDGATTDAEGYVWCAHWDGWRVVRYAPDGHIDRVVELPGAATRRSRRSADQTSSTMYVTSAYDRLTVAEHEAQPLAGALFALDVGVCGAPVPTFGSPRSA